MMDEDDTEKISGDNTIDLDSFKGFMRSFLEKSEASEHSFI